MNFGYLQNNCGCLCSYLQHCRGLVLRECLVCINIRVVVGSTATLGKAVMVSKCGVVYRRTWHYYSRIKISAGSQYPSLSCTFVKPVSQPVDAELQWNAFSFIHLNLWIIVEEIFTLKEAVSLWCML